VLPRPFPTAVDFDFHWSPKSWSELRSSFWRSLLSRDVPYDFPPFVTKIIVRSAQKDDEGQRPALETMARNTRMPVSIIERPRARLALAGGDAIAGQGGPGTIGGFLRERSSTRLFGVTCGHVAGAQGANILDGSNQGIGRCIHAESPRPNAPGALCRRSDPNAVLNRIDAALIDLSVTPTPATLGGWTSQFASWRAIAMTGAMAGTRRYITGMVGGLAPFYRMIGGLKQEFCFEDIFEVRIQTGNLIHPQIGALFATPPQQGDSGSWIELQGAQGSEWCGMLVGVDGQMGYAIEAQTVVDWAKTSHGLDLVVP
jgi:hypothetical protein